LVIFVDTGGWYALFVRSDPNRDRALRWFGNNREILRAWEVFRHFADKEWSFTDCTSKVVMEDLGIDTAFTFDHHFRQFGSVTVVP
jgi:predicted nucleic acid-binding protein